LENGKEGKNKIIFLYHLHTCHVKKNGFSPDPTWSEKDIAHAVEKASLNKLRKGQYCIDNCTFS
jgi:hypothetical protein